MSPIQRRCSDSVSRELGFINADRSFACGAALPTRSRRKTRRASRCWTALMGDKRLHSSRRRYASTYPRNADGLCRPLVCARDRGTCRAWGGLIQLAASSAHNDLSNTSDRSDLILLQQMCALRGIAFARTAEVSSGAYQNDQQGGAASAWISETRLARGVRRDRRRIPDLLVIARVGHRAAGRGCRSDTVLNG